MRVSIDVDCTPEEARAFLGLPDVRGLQEGMMKEMEERMRAAISGMEPEALMRMWMPFGGKDGWEAMQKRFWEQFGGGTK